MFILYRWHVNWQMLSFGVSAMLVLLLGSCNKDDYPAPVTVASTYTDLTGDWALIRVTGGIAGIDESYSVEESPETLSFGGIDSSHVDIISDTTIVTVSYGIEDVSSSNDTTFFTFSSIRTSPQNFYLSGLPMLIIDKRTLQSQAPCCDFFDYRLEKL